MATRMQQRRGTAAQWTQADPILAAGEIGFESDTNQFKIGDGINHWDDLSYFKNLEDLGGSFDDYVEVALLGEPDGVATLDANGSVPINQLSSIIDAAPGALDTLAELANAIQAVDGLVNTAIGEAVGNMQTYADTAANTAETDAIAAAAADATTKADAAQAAAESTAEGYVVDHNSATTFVHGISDTSQLATLSDVSAVTASSLGLGNVDNTSDLDKPVSTATETAISTAKAEALAEVTAVIDSAPTALNTLNELAAALNDDENFASTVSTALDAKVASYTSINQQAGAYTSVLADRDKLVEVSSATGVTITIPTNASVAYPVGTSFDVLQTSTGQVTIAGAAGVTVNATPGLKLRTQWSSATIFKRAENTWVVFGDLTA
jgi:hypothetical protein